MSLKDCAKQLKTDIPAVFLALKRRETPWVAKLLAGLTIGYALSPIDLIPDFIPVLGYLDDLIILPALVALTVRLIPARVMEECRTEAGGFGKTASPSGGITRCRLCWFGYSSCSSSSARWSRHNSKSPQNNNPRPNHFRRGFLYRLHIILNSIFSGRL